MKQNDYIDKDLRNCQLYVINGYICSFIDSGIIPNVHMILKVWYSFHYKSEKRYFNIFDISRIIFDVCKYDKKIIHVL